MSIISLILPNFAFAQNQEITPPKTLEEAKEIGEGALEAGKRELPGIFERIWEEEMLPLWQTMWQWFKDSIWSRLSSWFEREVETEIESRKPGIKEEFQKEKDELREEAPKIGQSLWERFKELIK